MELIAIFFGSVVLEHAFSYFQWCQYANISTIFLRVLHICTSLFRLQIFSLDLHAYVYWRTIRSQTGEPAVFQKLLTPIPSLDQEIAKKEPS